MLTLRLSAIPRFENVDVDAPSQSDCHVCINNDLVVTNLGIDKKTGSVILGFTAPDNYVIDKVPRRKKREELIAKVMEDGTYEHFKKQDTP